MQVNVSYGSRDLTFCSCRSTSRPPRCKGNISALLGGIIGGTFSASAAKTRPLASLCFAKGRPRLDCPCLPSCRACSCRACSCRDKNPTCLILAHQTCIGCDCPTCRRFGGDLTCVAILSSLARLQVHTLCNRTESIRHAEGSNPRAKQRITFSRKRTQIWGRVPSSRISRL